MSTTDGTSGRPGSGSDTPPASSGGPGAGGPGSGGSSSETRPMTAVRSEEAGTSGGQSGPGGSATKTATAVPAQKSGPQGLQGSQGAGSGAKTATAVSASGAPGGKVDPGQKGSAPAKQTAGPRPAAGRAPGTGRRVRLTVSRVDPWSAMKMSFLLSVALGIAMVVMVFVLWSVLAGMGIFDRVNDIAQQVFGADGSDPFDIMDYIGLGRVVSLSIVIGVIDVILFTAIATLGAFLYNVSAALVGGLQLTLTDD